MRQIGFSVPNDAGPNYSFKEPTQPEPMDHAKQSCYHPLAISLAKFDGVAFINIHSPLLFLFWGQRVHNHHKDINTEIVPFISIRFVLPFKVYLKEQQ